MLHKTQKLKETPSQTAGPYVAIGMAPNAEKFADIKGVYTEDLGAVMIGPDTKGERIEIVIHVIDGDGVPASDALIELWQADADGNYVKDVDPVAGGFTGFGRQVMNDHGEFLFETIKPGRVTGPDGEKMAPHVALWIVARGINIGLQTRLYFEDEADANAADWVLNKIPSPVRRQTLIARREQGGTTPRYVLDIHLQGENETVFFDV